MGVKEDLEAVLERTPRTPEDAEAMQEAASILASYLRLEEQVARLSGRSKRGEEAVRDQGSPRPRPRLGVFLGPGRAVGREIGDSDEPVAGEAWSWRSS